MYFDRFDICGAYQALENDWHAGGWLHERESNRRREESTGVQLQRMQYRSGGDTCCSWDYLENDNQRDIYIGALVRCGLAKHVEPESDNENRHSIADYILANYTADFITAHFPRLRT